MTWVLVSFLSEVVHAELVCTAKERAGGVPVSGYRSGGLVGGGAARGLVKPAWSGCVFLADSGHQGLTPGK